MHARFSDHAGLAKCSRWRSWTCCLPLHRQCRHPKSVFYRGSMAGLHVPLPTLRRHPRGCLRTAWGRCGGRVEVPVTVQKSGAAILTGRSRERLIYVNAAPRLSRILRETRSEALQCAQWMS